MTPKESPVSPGFPRTNRNLAKPAPREIDRNRKVLSVTLTHVA